MATFNSETGFSIEIKDFYLERRELHEGLPLYEVLGGVITAIAIVDKPAIERGVIANEATRIIYGPVMIPDLKIFRDRGLYGPENCYWFFSKETISKLQKTFTGRIKLGH
ncbi:MAG: hypothetical protein EOO08_13845 [Chitinophagaceae bacterium]|nr:MAG: hypothetical protein EOO08_13845 [Chitinophagaceae bacterium]